MITGNRAFEGKSQASLIGAIMNSKPQPMTEVQTMTPPALDRVVKKCLAKAQEDRWQSAKDLHDELRWIADGGSEVGVATDAAGVSSRTSWRGAIPLALAIGVGTIIASVAVWNLRPVPSLPVTRTVVALQADEVILPTAIVPLALSPDGSLMVYSAQKGNDPVRLYLRPMNSLGDQLLSGTDGATSPFFSPDGQWVGFFAARQLKKVPIAGGAVLTICSTSDRAQGASWGADDRIIFSSVGAQGLHWVSADGGTPETLTSPDVGSQDSFHRWPEILPGGQAVLFATTAGSESVSTIVAQRLDTGERKVLLQGGGFPYYVSTGHLVYNRTGTLMAVPFDLDRLEISGSPVPVIEGIRSPITALGGAHFAISRTGTLAYIAGSAEESASRLVWVDRQGVAEPLSAPPRNYVFPRVSPDGQRVAAGITEVETHIWVYDILRTTLTRQTFEGGINTTPTWSPDGKLESIDSTQQPRLLGLRFRRNPFGSYLGRSLPAGGDGREKGDGVARFQIVGHPRCSSVRCFPGPRRHHSRPESNRELPLACRPRDHGRFVHKLVSDVDGGADRRACFSLAGRQSLRPKGLARPPTPATATCL